MAIRVALNHVTEYRYDRSVTLQPHVIRLRPAPHCRTPILGYSLTVDPQPHFLNWQQDPYSNYQARVVFPEASRNLRVEVDLIAELVPYNPFDFFVEPSAEKYPFVYDSTLARELIPYLETAPAGPQLLRLVDDLRRETGRTVDYLVEINRHICQQIRYVIRMEPGVQTCEKTLSVRSGSCRDSTWLLVQTLRHLGFAARFVSGYLIQLVADVENLDGPAGPTHDFTDLHAWAEVYLPGAGWFGLDPTSGFLTSEGHIPLACAADPTNAAAVTGSYTWTADSKKKDDKVHEDFRFHMAVTRIHELPRVTKPYTEEQWRIIDALGNRIDDEMREWDVRLTMGGEPTFVSLDDRDGAEWNTTASGPGKRRLGGVLLKRLRDRFAKGGLLHFGQGKWYPGESLPRWAFGCYWRHDGLPIWNDPALQGDPERDYGHGPEDARRFITALADRLEIDSDLCIPSYEDAIYYLWRERTLPTNVDPIKNNLDDPEERRRIAKVFDQGVNRVVGYVLPLRCRTDANDSGWESGRWFLRREHLFLIPGDSPMGFRLPLDSLPWEPPENRDTVHEPDPFVQHAPLPTQPAILRQSKPHKTGVHAFGTNGKAAKPQAAQVRTALCVESRDGRMHVFLPPVEKLEDFLDLIAAIERTAAELSLPILLEGYKPPSDSRLNLFQVTPDPGVLEVNVHPARNWKELVQITTTLYDEARLARLTAEKFMLDGRHCGTGGGNHIILGGPTAADSPILRRPDLLRSLIACWHNHPSLSYLFSSLFVGPTSQAPRLDEARNDSLYELEIAFRQIPENGDCPPWLVDRLFRHLLTDVTGNTHRAEFCIDKLFSPDGNEGRRGLVEFRAFEMPPHARMSLVQQLLIRAMVAWFWRKPYRHKLARWGTELHDRFVLPHFIERDYEDLLFEMTLAGYPLQKAWFAPHLEFRFPLLGQVTHQGVSLELRQAIEPWHVLGEESGGGGTVRYVDSSVERVQLKVSGLTDSRHVVTCNGQRVPLHPTGTNGEFVAGVRYRAWQPPNCLHPTIPVQTPLVFDVYDTWTRRSIGGCQYHVMHLGGRTFETFPVTAAEAESRRYARFFPFGHTPASWSPSSLEIHAECPLTLDLRKPPAASIAIREEAKLSFDEHVATEEVQERIPMLHGVE